MPKRTHAFLSAKIFWLNFIFCILYWVLESVRDVFVFQKGNLLERIFSPDAMSFWMRMLVVFLFVLFGVYSNTLRKRIEGQDVQTSAGRYSYGILWLGVGFAVLYWALESFRDVFVFNRGDFLHRLVTPDSTGFWMRIPVVLILMLFSLYAQSLVNDRRRAEEIMKKNRDELEQQIHERTIELSKSNERLMEAVGVLAGGVAHDFNNLLTAIQGWTELALEGMKENNPVLHNLKEIHSASRRAADLIQQLLFFSRRKTMYLVVVNLNEQVKSLLEPLRQLAGDSIDVEDDFGNGLWSIKADRTMIEQVVTNLVSNAKDAMPNGGRIKIKTENVHVETASYQGDSEAKIGRFVCLAISDTGMGMGKNTLKHLFEPFFTTKSVGQGTGLGLSVIYGIVKQHDGWIHVSSAVDQGSTFQLYIPVYDTGRRVDTQVGPSTEIH